MTTASPSIMRAGVYRGLGKVCVEDVPTPQIANGEVLIRVEACGICGTDLKKVHQGLVRPPQILGHEVAGVIVEVSAGVEGWSVGDRVISFHHVPCGECFYCKRDLFSQCPDYKKVGLTAGFDPNGGGFAQYVRAMPRIVQRGMVRIPDDVAFDAAVFVEPVNTCLKAIRKARIEAGEIVVVVGQGPIGLLLSFLSRNAGATVLTSDPFPSRRAMSLRFGAVASFDPAVSDVASEVSKYAGRGADVVLLAAPSPALVPVSLGILRPGGRLLLFAQNDPSMKIEFPAAAIGVEEKEILGSYSAALDLHERSAEIVFKNATLFREAISHRFPLESIADAFDMATHPGNDFLKVVIEP